MCINFSEGELLRYLPVSTGAVPVSSEAGEWPLFPATNTIVSGTSLNFEYFIIYR